MSPSTPGSSNPHLVVSRRALLAASVAALVTASTRPAGATTPLSVVDDGSPAAVIVVPPTPAALVTQAANELRKYISAASGATLPILTEADLAASGTQYDGQTRIYVGLVGSLSDPAIPNDLLNIDADGYIIRTWGNSVTLMGPSPYGTRFAASAFLERFLNVRWLMPTPVGEDVPIMATINMPATNITAVPSFTSRQFSGVDVGPSASDKRTWMTRNRAHGRVAFHHNLHNMFPPSVYAATHPEYYPIINGVRYIPPADATTGYRRTGWQPSFSEPGTIDVAATYLINFFVANPGISSVSLGVNDDGGFSETDPVDSGGPNSVGLPGKSETYYAWVNAVVAQVVAAGHSDKTFGLLAYKNVSDPPTFTLDSRVHPFLTRDRYGWVDSTLGLQDKALLDSWTTKASQLGWYDYNYGVPYVAPRIYTATMAETMGHGATHGVTALYSEMYPNWGEGPKPWILTKLAWDSTLDETSLTQEWCDRAVGPLAGDDLAAYYSAWENYWTTVVPSSEWFASGRGSTYFPLNDPSYLAVVPTTLIDTTDTLMAAVQTKSSSATPKQQQRAATLAQMHSFYRSCVLSYPRPTPVPATATEATAVLDGLAEACAADETRKQLRTAFATDPLLYQLSQPADWAPLHPDQLWGIVSYCQAHEPEGGAIRDRLTTDSTSAPNAEVRNFSALALQLTAGSATQRLANSSYETVTSGGVANWSLWVKTTGTLTRTTSHAHTGAAALKVGQLARGGPVQVVPAQAGLLVTRLNLQAPAGIWRGTVTFSLNLQDASGIQIGTLNNPPFNVAPDPDWQTLDAIFIVPATAGGKTVAKAQVMAILNGFEADPDLYIDDFIAYQ
ncbi:DUF4838 domain-containing protein [Jiangella gansuensis]|uniref:DUF4838 domain-containing protein n=1 Tax=Jiangella gansuensis TaxID=281473 RepID=UPI0004B4EDAC|nr:DUF4838 domain-containing protein [Jiangella gansuensis]